MLEIVLANPNVKALLVNFCGAFARTDVMAEGVINAWLELRPKIPIVFTIHGTGAVASCRSVRNRSGPSSVATRRISSANSRRAASSSVCRPCRRRTPTRAPVATSTPEANVPTASSRSTSRSRTPGTGSVGTTERPPGSV